MESINKTNETINIYETNINVYFETKINETNINETNIIETNINETNINKTYINETNINVHARSVIKVCDNKNNDPLRVRTLNL